VEVIESSQRKSFDITYSEIPYGQPFVARARINVAWTIADTLTDLLIKIPGIDDSSAGEMRLAVVGCVNGNHHFKLALDRLLENNVGAFKDEILEGLQDSALLDCVAQVVAAISGDFLTSAARVLVFKFAIAGVAIQFADALGTIWNQSGEIGFLSNRPAPVPTATSSGWIFLDERFTAALFDEINRLRNEGTADGRLRAPFIANPILEQIARDAAYVAITDPNVATRGWKQPPAEEVQRTANKLGYVGAVTLFSGGGTFVEQPTPLEFIAKAYTEELEHVKIFRNSALVDLGLACYITSPTSGDGRGESFATPYFCVGVAGSGR
jgi:hypothetical protein